MINCKLGKFFYLFRTITPLFKLELYERLRSKFNCGSKNSTYAKVFDLRCESTNIVLNCGYAFTDFKKLPSSEQPTSGNIVHVLIKDHPQLAYILEADFVRSSPPLDGYVHFKIITEFTEASKTLVNDAVIKVRHIDNIQHELQVFESINVLQKSPLRDKILRPLSIIEPLNIPRDLKYQGAEKLNPNQYDAVIDITTKIAYKDCNIFLINGPPGTGKSHLISNLIVDLIQKNSYRILVCAQSNAAVDVIAKKLIHLKKSLHQPEKFKLVRCGMQKDKIDRHVLAYHNEQLAFGIIQKKIDKIIRETNEHVSLMIERKKLLDDMADLIKTRKTVGEETFLLKKIVINKEIERLGHEIYQCRYPDSDLGAEQRIASKKLISNANIVCTTLGSLANHSLIANIGNIDICIIDEATVSTEYLSLSPLRAGVRHLILVGDTKQLPALVNSRVSLKVILFFARKSLLTTYLTFLLPCYRKPKN